MEKNVRAKRSKTIIKMCHKCAHLIESAKEIERCPKCKKSFLPSNYFGKVHAKNSKDYSSLFTDADELSELDIITGITVIWD